MVCHSCNANWLIVLQDVLEDYHIDVDIFCDAMRSTGASNWFVTSRGRLRLVDSDQCTSLHRIREQLNAIE